MPYLTSGGILIITYECATGACEVDFFTIRTIDSCVLIVSMFFYVLCRVEPSIFRILFHDVHSFCVARIHVPMAGGST